MKIKIIKIASLVTGLGFSLTLTACTQIQAWERGNLAKPIMSPDLYALQTAALKHNYASREAAGAVSSGASGGGCGCN